MDLFNEEQPTPPTQGEQQGTGQETAPPAAEPTGNALTIESLSDEFKSSEMFSNLKGKENTELLNEMAKQIAGLQRLNGQKIRIPTDKDSDEQKASFYKQLEQVQGVYRQPTTPEEMAALYNKLGKPEQPEDYAIPEGLKISGDNVSSFKQLAHQTNLTQEQFNTLLEVEARRESDYFKNQEDVRSGVAAKAQEMLKGQWADGFEARVQSAKLALNNAETVYGKEMVEHLKATGAGSNPIVIAALSKLGEGLESNGDILDGTKPKITETADEIRAQIQAIRENPAFRKDKALKEQLHKLYFRLEG